MVAKGRLVRWFRLWVKIGATRMVLMMALSVTTDVAYDVLNG
jgi:hypothetical protein